MPYQQDALARVIDEVIAPGAAEVDARAAFPRRQMGALAEAGLLALTVPAAFGGGGEGLRAASHVVRELGAACGSTAMVVTMHYCATAALVAGGAQTRCRESAPDSTCPRWRSPRLAPAAISGPR